MERSTQVLNAKTIKPIIDFMKDHYGYSKKLDYVFVLSPKDNLYAVTKEVFMLPLDKCKINSVGLYVGEWKKGELRFSIEGSQIVGPDCTKNVVSLDLDQRKRWMSGEDVERASNMSGDGFVIVKCNEDFLGCGRLTSEKLLNFVPKNRRLNVIE